MAINKGKKGRRIVLCGSSTKVLSPRQTKSRPSTPPSPRSGSKSPSSDGKHKMGLFDRIRVFFARYRERLHMRRKLKRLTRKISDDQSLTKHPSIVKVPSLPAIMESPEVKDDDTNSQDKLHLDKKTSLKALFKELNSGDGNKEIQKSAEGSTSDFNDILNDEALIDSNKCSSAVITSKSEARTNTGPSAPIKNEKPFQKEIKTTSVWESDDKSLDVYSVSSIESIGTLASDYIQSSSSDEAIREFFNYRDKMGSINQKDAFSDQNGRQDDDNREVEKKKSNTKRVHFNLDPVIEVIKPEYDEAPMVPEQYYMDRRQEQVADNRMNNAQKRHDITTSESSTSSTGSASSSTDFDTDSVRYRRDRSLDVKAHPAVAKKPRISSFEQNKSTENSVVDARIPKSNKVKVIKMEETEESLYNTKPNPISIAKEGLYSKKPEAKGNETLYNMKLKPDRKTNEGLYGTNPEAETKENENLYRTKPKQEPKTNESSYNMNPDPETKANQGLYSTKPEADSKANEYLYRTKPKQEVKTNESLYNMNPEPPKSKPNEGLYRTKRKQERKTNEGLYSTKPEPEIKPNEGLYRTKPKQERKPNESLYDTKQKSESNTNVSFYNMKPEPESKPNEGLYSTKPEPESKPNEGLYRTKPKQESKPNESLYGTIPKSESKTNLSLYTMKPEPESKPNEGLYRTKPKQESKPNESLYGTIPKSESKTNLSLYTMKPEPESKPNEGLYSTKPEPESKPNEGLYRTKPKQKSKTNESLYNMNPEVKSNESLYNMAPEPESKTNESLYNMTPEPESKTNESLYNMTPEPDSKPNDADADLIREIERFAKSIVQNATSGGLERAGNNDRYSSNKSSFSLFDDGNAPQNLVKQILSQVKGPDYPVPTVKNDDHMYTCDARNPTSGKRKDNLRKLDRYFDDFDDEPVKYEYETTDSESEDSDYARADNIAVSRHPAPDEGCSDVSGWDKDENLAEYLTSYTANLGGDESMPVYSEKGYTRHKLKPRSGQIVIHDPKHFTKPISYPPPTPKAPSLPQNPFPVNKKNLPNVCSPKKGDYDDYVESKKKKKSGKKSHRKDKRSDMPIYVESPQGLGLLKEVTNRWEPTPSVFLNKKEPEDIYIKQKLNEPLLPIAGSRTSPVSNDVLFPNAARNSQMPVTQVYTQPMGKLSSKGRDSSGIDVSCFTGGYPVEPPEPKRKKEKSRHRKHKESKHGEPYPTVAKEHMDMYRKMQVTFKARETEVPDAKFWIDLNQGKYEYKNDIKDKKYETRVKPKKTKPKPKKAWEATSQSNSSSNSSKDNLQDEMNPREPLSPIGSHTSKRVSHDKAKENFHYFKTTAAMDQYEVKRMEDMQTDKRVLQKFHAVKKPLKPIEDVLPEEQASHAENMHFFKNITTTPAFWSDNVVPQEKKPKRYVPKKPLNPIPTNSPESPSSPAENMEFFKAVAQYPKRFYETEETNQYPNESPYFTEAPIGSTKENAGRCHCRESENLEFFRYISSNQDVFKDQGESSSVLEAVWKKNRPYTPDEDNYVDPITAEENMRFFKDIAKNPNDFYKTKASEEALSQLPRRRKPSIIDDDPRNYVDAGTAEENMEFFKKHAKKSKKGKKKNL